MSMDGFVDNLGETKGLVFNIQHYAIHDGPGIRTTVFVNGCPLRCDWCQNPESQTLHPQVFFDSERCSGCGRCVTTCPQKANTLSAGKASIHRDFCVGCGNCCSVCSHEGRHLMGKVMTAREVFDEVKKDLLFHQSSNGGITVSGGDPVAQPKFVTELLKLCKQNALHTAIETSGFAKWDVLGPILDAVDLVLFDFKTMSSEIHEKHTGVPNRLILENAKRIFHELAIPMLARLPVIPGLNDSVDNIRSTGQFIAEELGPSVTVHLLPYHRMGETKYLRLGMPDKIRSITPPTNAHMALLVQTLESLGLKVQLGG